MKIVYLFFSVWIVSSIVCRIFNKIRFPRKHKTAANPETIPAAIIPAPIVTSCKVDRTKEIKRDCLTEQLLFVEDLISSESNPEKTLKYMKEKQRILTALADL